MVTPEVVTVFRHQQRGPPRQHTRQPPLRFFQPLSALLGITFQQRRACLTQRAHPSSHGPGPTQYVEVLTNVLEHVQVRCRAPRRLTGCSKSGYMSLDQGKAVEVTKVRSPSSDHAFMP